MRCRAWMQAPTMTSTMAKPSATVESASTRSRSAETSALAPRSAGRGRPARGGRRRARRAPKGGGRRPHADRRQHAAEDRLRLVDVAAREELLRRRALELEPRVRTAGPRPAVFAGGLRQRPDTPAPRRTAREGGRSGIRRRVREAEAVEAGGVVEGELRCRPLGRALRQPGGALVSPAPIKCRASASRSHSGASSSARASPPWWARRALAGSSSTIISRMPSWLGSTTSRRRETRPHEARRAQESTSSVTSSRSAAARRSRHGQGASGDRHDLDQAARAFRQPLQPLAHHLVEGQNGRVAPGAVVAPVAAYELLDEKRAAARFARDRAGRSPRQLVVRADQRQRERAGVFPVQGVDRHVADSAPSGQRSGAQRGTGSSAPRCRGTSSGA